jgi:hypothetical protein
VGQENETGRASLPRTIRVWKDADEPGADKLLVENLKDRLSQAGKVHFDKHLVVQSVDVEDSKASWPLQIADLFVGSVNRLINVGVVEASNARGEFTEY